MVTQALGEIWAALNSSFGGPLLAIVTLGGALSLGRSLISFPAAAAGSDVTKREGYNQYRLITLLIGWVTLALLVANVCCYVFVFSAMRNGNSVWPTATISDYQASALRYFFIFTILSIVFGTTYAVRFDRLKCRAS